MSLWYVSVEVLNRSHTFESITGVRVAHFLHLVKVPRAGRVSLTLLQSQVAGALQLHLLPAPRTCGQFIKSDQQSDHHMIAAKISDQACT